MTGEKSVHFGITARANRKCYWLVSATKLSSIFASLAGTPSAAQPPRAKLARSQYREQCTQYETLFVGFCYRVCERLKSP